jgi:polyhydroxybutyrate depolymerase
MCAGGPVGFSRPATVQTFASYDCTTPAPLVILLHDYGSTGAEAEAYFGLGAQADAMGFLYVHPDGTRDAKGNEFWNATDACCNIDGSTVDDSSYLSGLIGDVQAQYKVDPQKVFIFGYGNGGFMAYRMACDHPAQVAAVASLGGATWENQASCTPTTAVSVIEIHGTADATFAYTGGTNLGNAYPSAQTTATDWSQLDRCKTGPTMQASLDLDSSLPGAETTVASYGSCFASSGVDLWSIQGGTHTPTLSTTFASTVLGALFSHARP